MYIYFTVKLPIKDTMLKKATSLQTVGSQAYLYRGFHYSRGCLYTQATNCTVLPSLSIMKPVAVPTLIVPVGDGLARVKSSDSVFSSMKSSTTTKVAT